MFPEAFFAFARSAGPESRLRFAPTPSGYLHVGNALNFALNWLVARCAGGKILLRIDDLDADRKRPEYVADIFESLAWLGLDWDEGPGLSTPGNPEAQTLDFEQHWSQHLRLSNYFQVLDQLREKDLLFACRKSRKELADYGEQYPADFRSQDLHLDDEDVAWRIKTDGITGIPGDFVVRRRDGIPAYQVASLADDVRFNITHIIRGADLEDSTRAQLFLAERLGEDRFLKIRFLHHPLWTDESGRKLSKSAGSTSLKVMREAGESPAPVFERLGELLGLPHARSAGELLESVRFTC